MDGTRGMDARKVERPTIRRTVVRVIVQDPDGRLLLLQDSDQGLKPVPRWWIPPGGGVEVGESYEAAALRELEEETGHRLPEGCLVGPVAKRDVTHGYSDRVVRQSERYYVARVQAFDVDTSGHTEEERLTIQDVQWVPRHLVAQGVAEVWPRNLLYISSLTNLPGLWHHGPVDLGQFEESTVPL